MLYKRIIHLIRRPPIPSDDTLLPFPELNSLLPAFPIAQVCFYFLVRERYRTGYRVVDLIPVAVTTVC
jgi:hypothetical protein